MINANNEPVYPTRHVPFLLIHPVELATMLHPTSEQCNHSSLSMQHPRMGFQSNRLSLMQILPVSTIPSNGLTKSYSSACLNACKPRFRQQLFANVCTILLFFWFRFFPLLLIYQQSHPLCPKEDLPNLMFKWLLGHPSHFCWQLYGSQHLNHRP